MTVESLNQIVGDLIQSYQYISGKLFNIKTKEEIKESDFKKMLFSQALLNGGYVTPDGVVIPIALKEIDSIIDNMLILNEEADWPELPLVTKARELGPVPLSTKLPFPLAKKQFYIINRLLFHPEDEYLFITTGIGGSGKSTFLNLIKQLFNNDFSPATISDLGNEFTKAEAVKHRLICSDELAKGELNNDTLKTIASKQSIFANPKYKTGYMVKTQSALFWCCNHAPKIDATDTGILRRIIFYCKDTPIQNPDPKLNKRVFSQEELLLYLRMALNFEDINYVDKYLIPETHATIMKDNSVYICWDARDYEQYRTMCVAKGLRPFSEPNWVTIRELFEEWMSGDNEKCEGN